PAQGLHRHVPALRHRRADRADHAGGRRDPGPRGEQPADVPAVHPQHRSREQRRDSGPDDSRGARLLAGLAGGHLARRAARQRSAPAGDRHRDRARARPHAAARSLAHSTTMGARVSDPNDFSLVLGGPLYQLWRRMFLSGPALELLARRMVSIPTIAWLPLLALSVWEGNTVRGVAGPVPVDCAGAAL